MTPETLAKVAKGLGGPYRYMPPHSIDDEAVGAYIWKVGLTTPSDGDLLLAILNRAAEMGYEPELLHVDTRASLREWFCKLINVERTRASTPLEAAALAFAGLPECQP